MCNWLGLGRVSTVQYSTDQYSTVQYRSVQYSTVQISTDQYSTVRYGTVGYSTVQYVQLGTDLSLPTFLVIGALACLLVNLFVFPIDVTTLPPWNPKRSFHTL